MPEQLNCFLLLALTLITAGCLSPPRNRDASPAPVPPGNRRALVVAISNYTSNQGERLPYAEEGAQAFAADLEQHRGFKVKSLYGPQATREAIVGELKKLLTEAGKGDEVLFFFSGHGKGEGRYSSETGYLVNHDCDPSDADDTCVWFVEILEYATDSKARGVLLILDACYSGAFGVVSMGSPLKNSALNNQPARQAITSSSKGASAYMDRKLRKSYFVHYFLEGLQKGTPVRYGNLVTVSDVFNYAREKIINASNGSQTPQLHKIQASEGEFFFTVGLGSAAADSDITKTEPDATKAPEPVVTKVETESSQLPKPAVVTPPKPSGTAEVSPQPSSAVANSKRKSKRAVDKNGNFIFEMDEVYLRNHLFGSMAPGIYCVQDASGTYVADNGGYCPWSSSQACEYNLTQLKDSFARLTYRCVQPPLAVFCFYVSPETFKYPEKYQCSDTKLQCEKNTEKFIAEWQNKDRRLWPCRKVNITSEFCFIGKEGEEGESEGALYCQWPARKDCENYLKHFKLDRQCARIPPAAFCFDHLDKKGNPFSYCYRTEPQCERAKSTRDLGNGEKISHCRKELLR